MTEEVPTIAMDYCFPSQDDERSMTVLVVADRSSDAWEAIPVNEKGGSDPKTVEKVITLIDEQWWRKDVRIICKSRHITLTERSAKQSQSIEKRRNDDRRSSEGQQRIKWVY